MKTNKKSFRKAALPVFGVLAASVMSLTSVTYAWFTSGNNAEVETINVGVQAVDGLQISVGKNNVFNWQSTVNPEIGNVTLSPVSTNGVVTKYTFNEGTKTAGVFSFFTATYNDTIDKITNITKIQHEAATDSYIAFDLYFRNPESLPKTINIDGSDVKSLAGFSHLAARVGFIEQGSISTLSANQTPAAFDQKFDGTVTTKSYVYEPYATTHTESGIEDYKKFKSGASENEVFTYKALSSDDYETYHFNRYDGKGYVALGKNDSYDRNNYANEDEEILVLGNVAGLESFVPMTIEHDFTQVTTEAALAEFVDPNGAAIYTFNETDTVYEEFSKEDNTELLPNKTYYVFSPVERYQYEEAATALSDITTVTDKKDVEFVLNPQTITKITIFIWLEGQDADCDNTIASYAFNVDLKFDVVVANEGNS